MTVRRFFARLFGASEEGGAGEAQTEKRRMERIDLSAEEVVGFSFLPPVEGGTASTLSGIVKNLSLRGCRVRLAGGLAEATLSPGAVYGAGMTVGGISVPLKVQVLRVDPPDEVALAYRPPFPKELVLLERFLQPRMLARTMREIDAAALKKGLASGMRWFQGANDTHLFSWTGSDGQIAQQQMIVLERVVEWRGGEPPRTGRVRQDRRSGGYEWVKSDLLEFDDRPDEALLAQATALAKAMPESDVTIAFISKVSER